jgi:prolyl-tRNA synthetase
VVIVPIWRTAEDLHAVEQAVDRIQERLSGIARLRVDWRDDRSPGFKFNEWDLRGVPLRVEVGPRDVAADQVVVVRRDAREKRAVPLATLGPTVESLLAAIQTDLYQAARRMLDEHTTEVTTYAELAERVATNAGWSLAHWCGSAACEAQVKAETKATIRCIPRDLPRDVGPCIVCGEASDRRVIFARAY